MKLVEEKKKELSGFVLDETAARLIEVEKGLDPQKYLR